VDAFLSPETRIYLRDLARSHSLSDCTCNNGSTLEIDGDHCNHDYNAGTENRINDGQSDSIDANRGGFQTIEIPLHSDSEFFHILKRELSTLDDLKEREEKELSQQVKNLGQDIAKVTSSSSGRPGSTLYAWREIFRLYIEQQIFFSTCELDSGQRNAAIAHQQLEKFETALAKDHRIRKLRKASRVALEAFMRINSVLLQNLKFQEINRIALTKIMKKFDKRTALHARSVFPKFSSTEPFLAQSMAKAVSYTISEEILNIIPQLNDYLCPICLTIAYKPVRLRCNHVFCIRCLVVMQKARQGQCALCRANVVTEANSGASSSSAFWAITNWNCRESGSGPSHLSQINLPERDEGKTERKLEGSW
jgi:hypothetical protein